MWFPTILLVAAGQLVFGICECGYSIVDLESQQPIFFTDYLETDFTRLPVISQNNDWVRQQFTVSAEDGRGDYGKAFKPENIRTYMAEMKGRLDEEAGLHLLVGSVIDDDGAIPGSELDTERQDLHWGSFRAGMKLTPSNGTCAAFFWYFNDTQEIDIEFLSREFDYDRGIYPVNLVVQSKQSLKAGYDASKTGTYKRVNLNFDPTDAFHEYRFDYTPNRVLFYADSKLIARMEGENMPSTGGHLILQHWSNGNQWWSGGPPTEDATVTVSYVKAYFNSSEPEHQERLSQECLRLKTKTSVICAVPDVTEQDARSGGRFFIDDQISNKKDTQDVNDDTNHATRGARVERNIVLASVSTCIFFSLKAGWNLL
ncbi:hypothetical protein CDV31_014631 [Fusarium ambrosium]|uniref:GH16 domain-containing protein n=1 Tax=Fusarium ambrosium TaxID=131363 RepID=A0A428SV38_9HYPO|nr:hypothetical protein CDV31_014631 [Fusarium ambrosium]